MNNTIVAVLWSLLFVGPVAQHREVSVFQVVPSSKPYRLVVDAGTDGGSKLPPENVGSIDVIFDKKPADKDPFLCVYDKKQGALLCMSLEDKQGKKAIEL